MLHKCLALTVTLKDKFRNIYYEVGKTEVWQCVYQTCPFKGTGSLQKQPASGKGAKEGKG